MTTTSPTNAPPAVAWLGYGGLAPFLGLAVLCALDQGHAIFWQRSLAGYGAVILSFVGALHWGFAMLSPAFDARGRTATYVWSVVPALVGWVALAMPSPIASVWLSVGFVAHYVRDSGLHRRIGLPAWYLPLRRRLTTVAVLSMVCAEIAVRALSR
jgi:Protein of unknown function (DUF3429)